MGIYNTVHMNMLNPKLKYNRMLPLCSNTCVLYSMCRGMDYHVDSLRRVTAGPCECSVP